MSHKKELQIFYLYYLLPCFIVLLIFSFIPVLSTLSVVVFLFSYIWNVFLYTPGMREKALSRGYRFSVVRVLYLQGHKTIDYVLKSDFKYKNYLAHALFPLVFIIICKILYSEVSIIWAILGLIFFEYVTFIYTRRKFKKSASIKLEDHEVE